MSTKHTLLILFVVFLLGSAYPTGKLGLNDTFAHGGSKQYLAKYYGFDAYALINSIEDFIGQKLNIADKDLETARIEDVHSLSKAEAL